MKPGMRFYIGAAIVWLGAHVWDRETRERFRRALNTGDPEERVPIEEVIIDDA